MIVRDRERWQSFLEYFWKEIVSNLQDFIEANPDRKSELENDLTSIKKPNLKYGLIFCDFFALRPGNFTLRELYKKVGQKNGINLEGESVRKKLFHIYNILQILKIVEFDYTDRTKDEVETKEAPNQAVSKHLEKVYIEWEKSPEKQKNDNLQTSPGIVIVEHARSILNNNPLLHAVICGLLKFGLDKEEDTNQLMEWLLIDSSSSLKVNTKLPVDENVITRRLMSSELEVFTDLKKAEFFLDSVTKSNKSMEIFSSLILSINRLSDAGDMLAKLMQDYYIGFHHSKIHSSMIIPFELSIKGDNIADAHTAMKRYYAKAAFKLTCNKSNAVTKYDFAINSYWKSNIFSYKLDIDNKSHLKKANEYIGTTISKLLKEEYLKGESNPENRTIKIVEGGVGGLETTYSLIKNIIDEFKSGERNISIEKIQYLGFEIEPIRAACSGFIMKGATPKIREEYDQSRFWDGVKDKLQTFNNKQFIINDDVQEGIHTRPEDCHDVDIFVCSYMFHHVPNDKTIRQNLFDYDPFSDKPEQEDRITKQGKPNFAKDFLHVLEQRMNGRLPEYEISSEAEVISSFLFRDLYKPDIQEIINNTKSVMEKDGYWKDKPDWERMIINPQRTLLYRIHEMLRPNGLIAIADPDGFSSFNKNNLSENPEMAVAYFLDPTSIEELLYSCRFEVIDRKKQILENADHYIGNPLEASKISRRGNIVDPNMGYIIIAKKI